MRDARIWPIGTPHTSVAREFGELLDSTGGFGIFDRTGVGDAYQDMFTLARRERRMDARPYGVLITSGQIPTQGNGVFSIPKESLVHRFEAKLSSDQIVVAETSSLREELRHQFDRFGYGVSRRGTATYEAMRESDHDDLLLAVMLATYVPRRQPGNPRYMAAGQIWDSAKAAYDVLGSAADNVEPAAFSRNTQLFTTK